MPTCHGGTQGITSKGTAETTTAGITPELQRHYDRENARADAFMSGTKAGDITMSNGQIIERYTRRDMLQLMRETLDDDGDTIDDNDTFTVLYDDGTVWMSGYDGTKPKYSRIDSVIYSNASTTAYTGKHVTLTNMTEGEATRSTEPDEDLWRLDFSDDAESRNSFRQLSFF